jgi:hypothetical protein
MTGDRAARRVVSAWLTSLCLAGTLLLIAASPVRAQQTPTPPTAPAGGDAANGAQDLAKKLANPVADLISVPFQENVDFGVGSKNGWKSTLNIQPVIPVTLNPATNLITRTILPVIYQNNVFGDSGSQFGLGDITASQFYSPKAPTKGGWIWGAGPVELIPTATDDKTGSKKWGLGPTVVALKQEGKTTIGMLANQIWSVAGDSNRPDVNSLFIQPFYSIALKGGRSYTFSTESSYDWNSNQWTAPLIAQVQQIMKFGTQLVNVGVGAKYYVAGAPDWGLRAVVVLLYPK